MTRPSCLILLTILAIQALAAEPSGPWPMFRHDPQRTGRSEHAGPTKPELRWRFKTGSYVVSSPAIGSDGTVYFGSWDGNLYAVRNGELLWSFETRAVVESSPAIGSDGTVYFGSWDGNLYAVRDGVLLWSFKTGDAVVSSPAIGPDGTVYFGSLDGNLYAVRNGELLWSFETGDYVWSSPAIGSDGTVYFGSKDGNLYALGEASSSPSTTPTQSQVTPQIGTTASSSPSMIPTPSQVTPQIETTGSSGQDLSSLLILLGLSSIAALIIALAIIKTFRESGRASREEEVLRRLLGGEA